MGLVMSPSPGALGHLALGAGHRSWPQPMTSMALSNCLLLWASTSSSGKWGRPSRLVEQGASEVGGGRGWARPGRASEPLRGGPGTPQKRLTFLPRSPHTHNGGAPPHTRGPNRPLAAACQSPWKAQRIEDPGPRVTAVPEACAFLGCREGASLGADPGLPEPGLGLGARSFGAGSFRLGFLPPLAGASRGLALRSPWAGLRGPWAALTRPPPGQRLSRAVGQGDLGSVLLSPPTSSLGFPTVARVGTVWLTLCHSTPKTRLWSHRSDCQSRVDSASPRARLPPSGPPRGHCALTCSLTAWYLPASSSRSAPAWASRPSSRESSSCRSWLSSCTRAEAAGGSRTPAGVAEVSLGARPGPPPQPQHLSPRWGCRLACLGDPDVGQVDVLPWASLPVQSGGMLLPPPALDQTQTHAQGEPQTNARGVGA